MSAHEEVHASNGKYIVGFVLAVILTGLSFYPVMTGMLEQWGGSAKVIYLLGMAIIQIVVQIVFFLHLNEGVDAYWNKITIWFTAVFVIVIIGGTWWAMQHLNYNNMSGSTGRIEEPAVISAPAAVETAPSETTTDQ